MSLEELRQEALKLGRSDAETLNETALKIFLKASKKASAICKTTLKSDLIKLAESAVVNPLKSNGKPKTKYELCMELEEKNVLSTTATKSKSKPKKTEVEKSIQAVLEEEYKTKLDRLETLMKSLEVEKESLVVREKLLKDKESLLDKERQELKESLTSRLEEERRERNESFVKVLQEKDAVIEILKKQNEEELKQDVERLKDTEATLLKQAELIKDAEDSRVKREEALRKQVRRKEAEAEKIKEKYASNLERLKEREKTNKTVLLEQLKKDKKKSGKLTDDEVKVKVYENPYFERMFKEAVVYLLETDDPKLHRSVTIKEIIQTVAHQRFIDYAKKQFNLQMTKFNSKEDILDKMLQTMMEAADSSGDLGEDGKKTEEDEELNADLAVFNVEKDDDGEEEKSFEMKQTVLNWPVRQLDVNSVDKLLTEIQSARTTTTDLVKVQKIVFNALGLLN
ncbi:membrane-bound metallopeptidase [Lymphocystis disease virus 3]|uniref:Membrane-bound metallopeptidase n=1 Tax=Lymphocystis disease virus 3 TaxID=2560566 RepID=A0A1B2RVZ5_9VIRU|nr:membrane-bound metallopeptidase [Lymphocystis disease virus Sa]AOC55156.1 membrane-bound metallopeptidase [Lymphocystis disease virus 3]